MLDKVIPVLVDVLAGVWYLIKCSGYYKIIVFYFIEILRYHLTDGTGTVLHVCVCMRACVCHTDVCDVTKTGICSSCIMYHVVYSL